MMVNPMEQAKQTLSERILQAAERAAAAGALPSAALNGGVEQPQDTANGDLAANHAMASAKVMRMAPRKIAEAIVAHLDLSDSWFRSAEIAGPGFLNFRLSDNGIRT